MNTSHNTKAFVFALQQTWLAAADPLGELSDDTVASLIDYMLVTEPSSTLPLFYEHRILERLNIAPVSPTLGERLQIKLAGTQPEWQTEQTGFSAETLEAICQDAIVPTSVPIMRMKRLVEFLKLSLEEVMITLQETAYRYQNQRQADMITAYAPMGRLAADNQTLDISSDSSDKLPFEYDETLRIYLERLRHELTNSNNSFH